MEYVICCLNIKESYARITNHFKGHPYIGFEEFIGDIDEVKNKSLYKKWQLAVVDRKLPWFSEAVKFFSKNKIKIIYFDDDYSEVISSIGRMVPEPAEDNNDTGKGEVTGNLNKEHRIKYIEKPTTKVVEKKIYTSLEKKLAVVCGLSRCAGSTTVTLNLAKYLSSLGIQPSVIEPPLGSPAIFNWIGIEERLDGSEKDNSTDFYSYPHEISNGSRIKSRAEYISSGILWIVPDDRKEEIIEWDYDKMLKLIYVSGTTPITLIDIGGSIFHESVKPLISIVEQVLVVIDPFPTSCKIGSARLSELLKLKGEGYPVNFIINKWNDGIDKDEFLSFLGVNPLAFIPAIDLSILYKANCKYEIALGYREVYEVMEGPLKKISSLFIPKDFSSTISKSKRTKKGFFNIIKKLVRV
jgi:hypothetical protein